LDGEHEWHADTLQHLADKLKLAPWQLLNPMSDRAVEIGQLFDALPEYKKASAHELFLQLAAFGKLEATDEASQKSDG
jgi:hypothetical protein